MIELKIVESAYCTIPVEQTIKRSWTERLLSRPWRPWRKTKVITTSEPDPNIYILGNTIFCHPTAAHALRQHLEAKDVEHNWIARR